MKTGLLVVAAAVIIILTLILPIAALAQAAVPAAPSGLAATITSATQVDLAWTDNSTDETGFRIERSTDGTTFTTLGTVGAGVTASSDATVASGSTYYYRVIATNAVGDSTPSAQVTIAVAAPNAPSGLAATIVSATRVDLAWTDNSNNEASFRIERSLDSFATAPSATLAPARNQTTFSDTTVVPPNTYYYRIVAVNAIATSAPSAVVSAKVSVPNAPSGLAATITSATQVGLAWTDNSTDEASFRIERSTDGTTFTALGTVGAGVTASSDATVTRGSTYYYRVVAVNPVGGSTPSNVVRALVAAPAVPSDLTAIVMSATRVDLIWTDQSDNESSFRIERSLDSFATAPSATFTAARDQRTYSDATVAATNTYSYRVVAVNGAGSSPPSNTASAIVNGQLQVGPIDPNSLYQGNPNSGYPGYYQDDQGTRVSLFPVTGDGLNAPTQIFDPVTSSNPYSVYLGFGSENFYYIAANAFDATTFPTLPDGKPGKVLALFGLEAASATGPLEPGQEVVFARLRLWVDLLSPGAYTIQHPWGAETFDVTAEDIAATGGRRAIRYVRDVSAISRNFTVAAGSYITRFVRQASPPPPAGWIGDGATVGTVIGSPTGFNAVRITGPAGVNLDGAGNNFVQSNLFTVSGRLLTAVTPLPNFAKILTPTTGTAPVTVAFTDTSTGAPTAWSWDFGDGTTSALRDPIKIYNAAGTYTVRLTVTNAAGKVSTSQTVTVSAAPAANFTNSLPNGLPPVSISFTDTSTGNPASWSWAFGDGASSTLQNPSHIYAAAGTYTINLTVTNPAGSASVSKTLGISPNLTAGFTKALAPTTGVAPVTVTFTDTSAGTITGWLWDFGDGTTSNVQVPAPKTYNAAGNYSMTLTVTDATGSAGISQTVSVYSTPVASFTKSAANGVPPLTVNFTDTSTGNPVSWSWDFGDGATSTLKNPSKTYTIPQNYTITLTVTNPAGTASTSQVVMVSTVFAGTAPLVLQMGPIDPRSVYQGNPNSGFPTYYQDDQGTRVGLLPISGDGLNAPTQIFDNANLANPYSVFLGFGSEAFYYIASATFNTSLGGAVAVFGVEAAFAVGPAIPGDEMVFTRLRFRAPVPAAGTYTLQHPWGTKTFDVTTADVAAGGISFVADIGSPRDFLVAGSSYLGRFVRQAVPPPPAGWVGDGATTATVTGSPTNFNAIRLTGPVGVNLDGSGNNFVQTDQFTVSGRLFTALTPGFTMLLSPVNGAAPVTVTFAGTATGGVPASWLWSFGDGSTSTLQNPPVKTYATPGNYTVTLTVSDGVGTGTASQVLHVYSPPVASFTKSAVGGFAPLSVSFADTSTGNPVTWLWSFGDGTTSTLQNPPTKTYATAGTFTITLTVTNPAGQASTSQTVAVGSALAAPTALGATSTSATLVNLTWTDSSTTETAFVVERSTGGGAFATVGTPNSTTTNTTGTQVAYTDTTVVGGTTYTYRVRARNTLGDSVPSAVATVTTPNVQLTGLTSTTGLSVNGAGVAQANATVTTSNGTATLTIAQGTTLLTRTKQPITALSAAPLTALPSAPPRNTVVLATDFGPDGATFKPALTVTMKYNPAALPAGINEARLSIAYWDGFKWFTLKSTVNTVTKTITATNSMNHFTVVGILGLEDGAGEEDRPDEEDATATIMPTPTPAPPSTPMPAPKVVPEDKVVPVLKKEGETSTIVQPTKEVKVELEDKTAITVPPMALPATVQMKARSVPEKDLPKPPTSGKVRKALEIEVFDDKGVKIQSPEIRLPITIQVPLSADDMVAIGGNPNNVELHRYDDGTGAWVKLAADVDLVNKVIRANLRHLSLFAVVVPAPVAQVQPTPTPAPTPGATPQATPTPAPTPAATPQPTPTAALPTGGAVPGSATWLVTILAGAALLLLGFRLLRGSRQPIRKE